MGRPPTDTTTKGMVRAFLRRNFSYSIIMKRMMQEKRPVSIATISRIKKEIKEKENSTPKKEIESKKVQKKNQVFKKLSIAALRKIDNWTSKDNALTQQWMALKLGVTPRVIR